MKIQLKENSSIEIVSKDGDTIVKVSEDGGIELKAHSFDELEQTLQEIVYEAIAENGNPVDCTYTQWNDIKALLNKSLYIYYDGYSLIKTATNGIDNYLFGSNSRGSYVGYTVLELRYIRDEGKLYANITEA